MFLKVPKRCFWSMKSLACLINIILKCMKSIMGQAIFSFCSCFVSCCLEFLSLCGSFLRLVKKLQIFLGFSNTTSIDNNVSQAIKRSGQISMRKTLVLPEKNIQTTIVSTKFENGNGKNATCP